jgi:hypothetical protein
MTIHNQIKRVLAGALLAGAVLAVGAAALAAEHFVRNGNGTIKDEFTGLTWIQNPSLIPAVAGQKTYTDADQACQDLVYAGLGPKIWRLPTIMELKSVYDGKFKNPRINTAYFGAEGGAYWSATPYLPGSKSWTLNFKTGYLGAFEKQNPDKPAKYNVRCVTRL